MRQLPNLRAMASAVIYLMIYPPGDPPRLDAPRSAWTGDGVRYASADECGKALAKRVIDSVTQRRGQNEVSRAKNGRCVRVE